ncbi:MAG: magnesium and cobalt transport protein CorA, partial [Bacteroidales bacterium]|nr:magnesium and cobalt transport protein CorA [Bacteroidales bacterium]
MLEIFYKNKGQVITTSEITSLDQLGYDDVLWIDLWSPSGDEKRAIETYLNTTIQSRAQAEEIESSSRYSENETSIFANTN